MRHDAKAQSTDTTMLTGRSLGLVRRVFAANDASVGNGSGALSVRRVRALVIAAVCVSALFVCALFSTSAYAGLSLSGTIGTGTSGAQAGQFNNVTGVAVNTTGAGGVEAGSVYAVDSNNSRIQQFTATGTPVRVFGYDVVESGPDNTTGANANEVQKVVVEASGGRFSLEFSNSTTGANGTGTWAAGTTTITVASVTKGAFAVGEVLTGTGLPTASPLATVVSCSPSCASPTSLTLSQPTISARTTATNIVGYNFPYNASAGEVESALNHLSTIEGVGGSVSVSRVEKSATEFEYSIAFNGKFSGNHVAKMPVPSAPAAGLEGATKSATVEVTAEGGGFEVCRVVSSPADVCKAGVSVGLAGALAAPQGAAVDPANGNLYVTDQTNRRIDVYSAVGAFEGAFGWGVDNGASELQFCTTLCQAGLSGSGAGQFNTALGQPVIDPTTSPHDIYVGAASNMRVDVFAPVLSGGVVTGVSFVKTVGWDVVSSGPDNTGTGLEVCNLALNPTDVCKIGITAQIINLEPPFFFQGEYALGFFSSANNPTSIALDTSGSLYAVDQVLNGSIRKEAPSRVMKFSLGGASPTVEDFAPERLFLQSGTALEHTNVDVAVSPTNNHVLVAKRTVADAFILEEFDKAGDYLGSSPITPLSSTSGTGGRQLAFGTEGRVYFANGNAQKIYILAPPPAPGATIVSVGSVSATTATFRGTVTPPPPGAEPYPTSYHFEYSSNGISWSSTRSREAGNGTGSGSPSSCPVNNPSTCEVEETVNTLQPHASYLVRLVATTGTTTTTETKSFATTAAPPSVTEELPENATKTTVQLRAEVNPSNEPTTYHFEWGTTPEYGNDVPSFEAFAGAGGEPTRVVATVSGLTPGAIYHFRIVAQNAAGTTDGPDEELETLDSCGLPDGRCFELVSPPDKGPAGVVTILYEKGGFHAAPDGESVVYPYLSPSEASAGNGLMYLARRLVSGWSSTQLSPPSLVSAPEAGTLGPEAGGWLKFMSPNFSCSIFSAYDPLNEEVPAADNAFRIRNLFSRGSEGSWRLITTLVPLNLGLVKEANGLILEPSVYGASPDCGRVYFSSPVYEYLSHSSGLYESDGETIRDAGVLPDGSTPAGATENAVSEDGSRFFFSASSDKPATSGKQAVFVREAGKSVEVTEKQGGANTSLGSRYALASKDGSHIFFISTYGLTSASSAGSAEACNSFTAGEAKACDVYSYDTENGHLTDLSADTNGADTKGAAVQQVLASSKEGRLVYFTALGQLIPGKGKTYAENTAPATPGARTVNVYLSEEGTLHYVATVGVSAVVVPTVTPDGRHLLFTSAENLAGSENGGASEAYLYSAASGEVQCVSCRRDGQSASGVGGASSGRPVVSEDGSRVFFISRDALAQDGVQGNLNVYEWKRGQIFLLVAGQGKETSASSEQLYGASPSGNDVFFGTIAKLVPQDVDSVADFYDARAGGGFAAPETPPAACDPTTDQCQGLLSSPPAAINLATIVTGPGNPIFQVETQKIEKKQTKKPSKKKPSKKKVKKKKPSKKQRSKAKGKRAQRPANNNRGGAK